MVKRERSLGLETVCIGHLTGPRRIGLQTGASDSHFHSSFTPKQILIYALCLLLAVVLHTAIYHFLHDPRGVEAPRQVVRIHIVSSPVSSAPAKSLVKSTGRQAARSLPDRDQAASRPQFQYGKAGYQKLLPSASRDFGESDSVMGSDGSARLGEKLSPRRQSHLAIMASEFDIPLHWRKYAKPSLAVAKLAIREDGEIWCRLLTGEPMLRAVLWKYLQKPSVYKALSDLLRGRELKDYQIRLRFVPEEGPERELNFGEGSAAYARGVEIIKTLPSPVTDFGGIEVSDAHSRKAKLMDRLAIADLYDSPAFIHQIREVKLGPM